MNKRNIIVLLLFIGFLIKAYDYAMYYLIDQLEGWIPLAEHFGMEG